MRRRRGGTPRYACDWSAARAARDPRPWGAAAIVGLALGAAPLGPAPPVTSNGSLSIDPAPPERSAEVVPETLAPKTPEGPASPTPDDAMPAVLSPPSPIETQALGRPNGMLSARPEATDAPGLVEPDEGDGQTATTWLDPSTLELGRVLGALGIVIALLLGLRALLRRLGPAAARAGRPSGVVEVLARYPVGRGQQLLVLKVARRVLVVHQAGTAMTTLSEMTDREEVAALLSKIEAGSRRKDQARFGSLLRRFEAEHEARATRPRTVPPFDAEIVDLTRQRRARAGRGVEGVAS